MIHNNSVMCCIVYVDDGSGVPLLAPGLNENLSMCEGGKARGHNQLVGWVI